MKRAEMAEAVRVLGVILDALLATLEGRYGRSFMTARHAIGKLRADAEDTLDDGVLGAPLAECFDLCRGAGATRVAMDGVRRAMVVQQPKFIPGTAVATAGIFLSLVEQAQILVDVKFESRETIDQMIVSINQAFDPAEEFAALWTNDPRVYQAIVSLHAAMIADLTQRARPLPRMVRYEFASRMPSLKLAMRIYGDAHRADQLRMENRTVHPAFCQQSGRCLSA